jgi:hypothetical protein
MFADKYEIETFNGPSMATIRARQKAAFSKKCSCGKLRDPANKTNGQRNWIACLRCFGTIKQLPDTPLKYRVAA